MKKKNMKTMITRILACALLIATLGLSLASCAAKDKVKDAARKAWDTAVDGAKKIYDSAKDKIAMEQVSGMAAIGLLSAEETVTTPTYAGTLKASDFAAGNWTNTNGKGALYVQSKECVGTITSVTGATIGDYWSAEAGEKPVVAIDDNNSKLSVLLPAGYTDVETWAATATDFSITVTPVMEKTLQAIVYPESATDKSVTWSVSCTDAEVDASDYIRLLTFDGAAENKISVLALQPFGGHEFIIKCATVIGGFSAECKVTYVGEPSRINAYYTNADGVETLLPGFVAESSAYKPTLLVGSTSDIRLALDNVFHNVGADYGNYKVVSMSMAGIINVRHYTYNMGDVTEGDISQLYLATVDASQFIAATVDGDTLHIKVNATYKNAKFNLTGGYSGSYDQYVSDCGDVPYFVVTVEDQVSGKQGVVRFKIDTSVTAVSLSDNTLTF